MAHLLMEVHRSVSRGPFIHLKKLREFDGRGGRRQLTLSGTADFKAPETYTIETFSDFSRLLPADRTSRLATSLTRVNSPIWDGKLMGKHHFFNWPTTIP